jgi:hypothetical protein
MKKEENVITLHDSLTGAAKKYHKQDITEIFIVYKRTLESFDAGDAKFTRKMIFEGEREHAEIFLKQLQENGYLQTIPDLDAEYDPMNIKQYPFMFRRIAWEIGMISVVKAYSVKEGAKPFWEE